MAIKQFNSVAGYSVGEDPLSVIDANANVAANALSVSGNATINGNLVVNGTFTYLESTVTYVTDPIVEQGGASKGNVLTSNDNKDRGTVLHYYDGVANSAVNAFIGWDNSNVEFALASNVAVANNNVTFNDYGNLRVNNINMVGSITAKDVTSTGNLVVTGSISATGGFTGVAGNTVPLGAAADGNLVSPGTITTWTAETKVTDAIDDLNEAMENVRNSTYVKSVAFTGSPTASGVGSTVTLAITSVGTPNRYDVNWGDSSYSNGGLVTNPTHVYTTSSPTPYTVTVRGYNNAGVGTGSEAFATRESYITIYTANPVVSYSLYRASTGGTALTGSTLYASEGETIYLENLTTNTTGATVTYTVNWGDGVTETIVGNSSAGGVGAARKSHVYATGQNSGTGTKTITLTLTAHNTATPSYISAGPNSTSAIKVYNPSISAPSGLGTKTVTFSSSVGTSPYLAANFANNAGGATTYVAGVSVNRTIATTGTIETITMTSFAYDGDSGTLSSIVNSADTGNITLATGNNAGTNGSLVLVAESDYNLLTSAGIATTFGLSTYSPSLYKGFTAKVATAASGTSTGLNNMKLSHSTSGNTNIVEFIKDDVILAPTVDLTSATLANATNGTYRYISGVPYYNTGSPTITLAGANIYNWIGQTYQNSATPFQIEAGTNDESTTGNVVASQTKTYANLDGATTFLTSGIPNANTGNVVGSPYTIGSQAISITASSIAAVQTVKFLATNVNGTGSYATHAKKVQVFTAAPTGFIEDSITCTVGGNSAVAKRIVIAGTGSTRTYTPSTNYYTSGLWTGAQTIAGTDAAVVRWNQLKNFSTDLTGYLPAGPDLATGRSGQQYFFGSFTRTARSSITVTISGTIRGLFFAVPGTTIDTTSSLNGWLDASISYNGSGIPGVNSPGNGTNGCAVGTTVPKGTLITNQTYTISFGTISTTNSTGNQVLFSIALNAGDTVTSWSFA
jgi:hypothetical protein